MVTPLWPERPGPAPRVSGGRWEEFEGRQLNMKAGTERRRKKKNGIVQWSVTHAPWPQTLQMKKEMMRQTLIFIFYVYILSGNTKQCQIHFKPPLKIVPHKCTVESYKSTCDVFLKMCKYCLQKMCLKEMVQRFDCSYGINYVYIM